MNEKGQIPPTRRLLYTMAYILDFKGVLWRAQGGIAELS